jgi:hypothetical protein
LESGERPAQPALPTTTTDNEKEVMSSEAPTKHSGFVSAFWDNGEPSDEVRRLNAQVPELMGRTEVARVLGVAPTNLEKICPVLPPPALRPACGPLWRADLIRAFAAERKLKASARPMTREGNAHGA